MNSLFHDSQSNEHPDSETEGRKESNKKFEKRKKNSLKEQEVKGNTKETYSHARHATMRFGEWRKDIHRKVHMIVEKLAYS